MQQEGVSVERSGVEAVRTGGGMRVKEAGLSYEQTVEWFGPLWNAPFYYN